MFMFHMKDVGAIPMFRTITIMKIKEKYKIKEIGNKEARDIVINNHYLHRARPATNSFGLFEGDELIGVILYSSPASPNVCRGICGEEEIKNVLELSRLWIKDDSMKNAESFLIANTIKLLKHDIIISYSEPEHNHRGIVYQASNFIYVGLSAIRTDFVIKGMENKHQRSIEGNTQQLKDLHGKDNVKVVARPRKHRYIYFNCSKAKRKYLLSKLKYTIQPYPKEGDIIDKPKEKIIDTPKEIPKDLCQICGAIYTGMTYEQHETRPFHQDRL